jgi:hypothetical protein
VFRQWNVLLASTNNCWLLSCLQSQPLAQLLQQCCGPDAAADLQLNVVAALGQLARDQQAAAEALMDPQGVYDTHTYPQHAPASCCGLLDPMHA